MKALVTGSTGLIGAHLTSLLLESPSFTEIHALVRRPTGIKHVKYQEHVIDFDRLEQFSGIATADVAFCCLGTTMRKAGSKDAFFKIDFEYVLAFGKLAKQLGCRKFMLVSAMGADKGSMFYYNRVKGQIEEAVSGLGFSSVHLMRPSLLLGNRTEERAGEDIGKGFNSIFGWMLPDAYKGVEGKQVALMMRDLAKSPNEAGVKVHFSDKIRAFQENS